MTHAPLGPTSKRFAETRGREYVRIMRALADESAAELRARANLNPPPDARASLDEDERDLLDDLDTCVRTFDDMTHDQLQYLLNGIHDELQEQLDELIVIPASQPTPSPEGTGPTLTSQSCASSVSDDWETTMARCYEHGRSVVLAVADAATDVYGGASCDRSVSEAQRELGTISTVSSAEELRYVIAGANFQAEQCIALVTDIELPQPKLHRLTQTCPSNPTLVAHGHAYIANLYWALFAAATNDEALSDQLYEGRDELLGVLAELDTADLRQFIAGAIESIGVWLGLIRRWTRRDT